MLDLAVNSLRMRPDRILVGEIRKRAEAEVLFEAMHTGHSVYGTLHANNIRETINEANRIWSQADIYFQVEEIVLTDVDFNTVPDSINGKYDELYNYCKKLLEKTPDDMLALQNNAKLILTDSGGIQEESCSLRVPCVVVRYSSDRPESLHVGAAMLAGCDTEKIVDYTRQLLDKERNWENPYGDGTAGRQMVEILERELK